MAEPIRILHEVGRMESGGIQQMIMNIYNHLDREKVQFDFMVYKSDGWFEDEIRRLGGKIHPLDTNLRKSKILNNIKKEFNKYKILKQYHYNTIHIHCGKPRPCHIAFIPLVCGVEKRIYHGHNSERKINSFWQKCIINMSRILIGISCNTFFACSDEAAKWNFMRKTYESHHYIIIKNGIETAKFAFDKKKREETRKKLGVQDNLVIGHIGRFAEAKNHLFLIEVFKKVREKKQNAVLLLIGEGYLLDKIKDKVKEYNLQNNVIFYGVTREIENLYMVMDVFLLPSLYEGFGIVAIESQTAGLPTIVADTIPDAVKLTELIDYLSIKEKQAKDIWADKILSSNIRLRTGYDKNIMDLGYDIDTTAKKLEILYTEE